MSNQEPHPLPFDATRVAELAQRHQRTMDRDEQRSLEREIVDVVLEGRWEGVEQSQPIMCYTREQINVLWEAVDEGENTDQAKLLLERAFL